MGCKRKRRVTGEGESGKMYATRRGVKMKNVVRKDIQMKTAKEENFTAGGKAGCGRRER